MMNININKHKLIFQLLVLSSLLTSNITQAHEVPKTSINAGLLLIQNNAFGSLSGANLSVDKNDFAGIFSLNQPESPSVAFEAGALTGFESSANITKSKSGTLHGKSYSSDGALTLEAKTEMSYFAGMKFSTSNHESINAYIKTGLHFWEVDFSVSGSNSLTYNGTSYNSNSFLKVDGSDPYLGLGLTYNTSNKSFISFDYLTMASTNAIQGAEFDIDGYSLTWSLNF